MKKPSLVPLFGCRPHTPDRCGETPEHMRRYLPKRRKGKAPPKPPCDLCGGAMPIGSPFICMNSHHIAADKVAAAMAHDLGPLPYDRRIGEPKQPKQTKPPRPPKLTARERAALLADAGEDGSLVDADTISSFLADLDPLEPAA